MSDLFLLSQLRLGGELPELLILRLMTDPDYSGLLVLVSVNSFTLPSSAVQLIGGERGVCRLCLGVDGVRAWKPADFSSDSWLFASMLAQPASVNNPQTPARKATASKCVASPTQPLRASLFEPPNR